jgi:hypothetical protein
MNFAPWLMTRMSIRVSSALAAPNNPQSALSIETIFRIETLASFDYAFSLRSKPVRFRDIAAR